MRKTHLVLLAVFVALSHRPRSRRRERLRRAGSDTTAPTTVQDVAATVWNDVTIIATATDDEGIRYVYHEHLKADPDVYVLRERPMHVNELGEVVDVPQPTPHSKVLASVSRRGQREGPSVQTGPMSVLIDALNIGLCCWHPSSRACRDKMGN